MTRATHNLDTQLKNDEKAYVWVDDAGSGIPGTVRQERTDVDGSGNLSGGTAMYFPSTGNAVNIYAIHRQPYRRTPHSGHSRRRTLWQQTRPAVTIRAGWRHLTSLHVWSNVARTSQAVNLQFSHLLSKNGSGTGTGRRCAEHQQGGNLNTKAGATFTPDKTNGCQVTAAGANLR